MLHNSSRKQVITSVYKITPIRTCETSQISLYKCCWTWDSTLWSATKHRYSRSQRIGVPYLPDTRIRPIHPDTRVPRVFQFSRFKKKKKNRYAAGTAATWAGGGQMYRSKPITNPNPTAPALQGNGSTDVVDVLLCLLAVVAHLCRLMARWDVAAVLLGSESVKQTGHLRAVAWQASSLQSVEVNATLLVLMVKRLGLAQYFDLISRIQAFWSLLHEILLFIYICLPYRRIAVFWICRIPYRRIGIAVSVSPYRCFIDGQCTCAKQWLDYDNQNRERIISS